MRYVWRAPAFQVGSWLLGVIRCLSRAKGRKAYAAYVVHQDKQDFLLTSLGLDPPVRSIRSGVLLVGPASCMADCRSAVSYCLGHPTAFGAHIPLPGLLHPAYVHMH